MGKLRYENIAIETIHGASLIYFNSNELAQNTSIRIRHILHVSSFFSFGIDPAELDGIVDEDLKKEFIEAMNSEDLIFCAPMFSRPKSG